MRVCASVHVCSQSVVGSVCVRVVVCAHKCCVQGSGLRERFASSTVKT